MGLPIYYLVVLIIGLTQNSQSAAEPSIPTSKILTLVPNEFVSYNWPVKKNHEIPLYVRNFNRHRQFGYVTHNPSSLDHCEITFIDIGTTPPEALTCEIEFRNPESSKLVWGSLTLGTLEKKSHLLVLNWTTENALKQGVWFTEYRDMKSCNPGIAGESADSPTTPTPTPVFSNSSPTTTEDSQSLGSIDDSTEAPEKSVSNAHLSIGTCWKQNTDISCSRESMWSNITILNNTHLTLLSPVDWFGVHNLKRQGMLVLTGKCPEGRCDSATLYRLEENDQTSMQVNIEGLNVQCRKPANLTVDAVYDREARLICFNLVCVTVEIQYRRFCIAESAVEVPSKY